MHVKPLTKKENAAPSLREIADFEGRNLEKVGKFRVLKRDQEGCVFQSLRLQQKKGIGYLEQGIGQFHHVAKVGIRLARIQLKIVESHLNQ